MKRKIGKKLKVISLFSGCGGMDYGAALAGCDVIYANDISREAIQSFRWLVPDAETFVGKCSEIRKLPNADVVCGGYPCQSFSMGGNRDPAADSRTLLYRDFIRVVGSVRPKFFIVENVPGLVSLDGGAHFKKQLRELRKAGDGYRISWRKLNSAEYGVPQKRHRVILVGVRRDLDLKYVFPAATHGSAPGQLITIGHGTVLAGFDEWPTGDFYARPGGEEDNFPWYYMSRNRRANATDPSFTIVANWRHTPLHPSSPLMTLTWSNLADGFKQRWDFSENHESGLGKLNLGQLEKPRRLSWSECAAIQTFPSNFEPVGSVQSKFEQLGNAVPPQLARQIFAGLVTGDCLVPSRVR